MELKIKSFAFAAALALRLAAAGAEPAAPSVVPDLFLRGYDPVTVLYGSEVGPAGGGPADGPGDWLRVSPAVSGEYRWLDSRTIQFLPAAPWPALERFAVSYRGGSRSLVTMMVVPSAVVPSPGAVDLDPIDSFTLQFPAAIPRERMEKMVRIEVRPLPGVDSEGSRWLRDSDLAFRELESGRGVASCAYRVSLREPVPYGSAAVLHVRLSLDDALRDSIARYTFKTKPDFRLVGMGSGRGGGLLPVSAAGADYSRDQAIDCGDGSFRLALEFSERLPGLGIEELKSLVRFEPAVRNLAHEVSGARVNLRFEADRDRPYKLSLSWQPLRGESGRALSRFKSASFWFFGRQASPFASWRQSSGIVERYGPQYLPMSGRGLGKVDLRIHRVDPLDLDFWPFPDRPVAIKEDSRPPMPGEEPEPGKDVPAHIRLLGSPPVSAIVPLPITEASGTSAFGLDLRGRLAGAWGADRAGTYIVGVRTLDKGDVRNYVRLTVTDLCLTAVEEEDGVDFVVTSLRSGAPVEGAEIRVDGFADGRLSAMIQGRSDRFGHYRYAHAKALPAVPARVSVSLGEDVLVVDPKRGPPVFANNHWFGQGGAWLEWLSAEPRKNKAAASSKAYLICERPVYRPEESVHLLGWVRDRRQGEIVAYSGARLEIAIVGEDGKERVFEARPEGFGRVYLRYDDKDGPTGEYKARLRVSSTKRTLAEVSFRKESYRVPAFKVDIAGPDRAPVDRPFRLVATADYYAGGRVVGAEIGWRVERHPYAVRSPSYPGFVFSADERYSGSGAGEDSAVASEGVLDEEGSCALTVDPTLEGDARGRRYSIEATVKGADLQTVTQTKTVLVLPPFNVGVKVDRFMQGGSTIEPSIVVLDHAERPLAGMKVAVRVFQRQWHSYIAQTDFTTGEPRFESEAVDTKIAETELVSGIEPSRPSFGIQEPGVYIVESSVADALGRRVSVKTDLFVAGPSPVSWERKKNLTFEAATDKGSYRPGETVRVVLKSPFQEGWALVAAESPRANVYSWVRVSNGQGIHEFKAEAAMAPGLPIAILLERGRAPGAEAGTRDQGPAPRSDLGKPAALGASLVVRVAPSANQAVLSLDHAPKAEPGTKLPIKLALSDADGAPIDGEVALWLVDKAVLALGNERALAPLEPFIDPAKSWIRIRDTRNLVVGSLPLTEEPGGDGELFRSVEDLLERATVRRNFKTVPYFNPSVLVRGGKAEVVVDLPDNLTEFALRAVAVAGYGRFGAARSSVAVRLPVVLQTAMPRFVRPGDSFAAGALGRVTEGPGGPAIAVAKTTGLILPKGSAPGLEERRLMLPDKAAAPLRFDMEAPASLPASEGSTVSAAVYLRRESDGASDAFELPLPVRDDTRVRRLASLVKIESAAAIPMPDPAPAASGLKSVSGLNVSKGLAREGSVKRGLVVTRDPRLLSIISGLGYLSVYPHDCLEQRISKLYPAVALAARLSSLGLADSQAFPAGAVADTLAYMAATIDQDGFFGFWPGSQGNVTLTAYAVEFLAALKAAKRPFDESLLSRARSALASALRSDSTRLVSGYAGYQRVDALAALSAAGAFDQDYAQSLLASAQSLPLGAQARLLALLAERGLAGQGAAQETGRRLAAAVVTRIEAGKELFAGLQDKGDPWGGPALASRTKTIAAMIEALAKTRASPKIAGILVDELYARSAKGGFGGTNDAVYALRALLEVFAPLQTGRDDVSIEVVTASGRARRLTAGSKPVTAFALDDQESLSFSVRSGASASAPLWASMTLEYRPLERGSKAAAANAGFAVTRDLEWYGKDGGVLGRAEARGGSRAEIPLGAIVEERVSVVNFEDREYVAVVVPIASGFEPLNPSLTTSPPHAKPSRGPTLKPTYARYLDDRVCFYYEALPKGTYELLFRSRASFAGNFASPAATAELMYALEVSGQSEGLEIAIPGEEGG